VGIAFPGIEGLTEPTGLLLLIGELLSGILAAWVPLLLPMAGCFLLLYLRAQRTVRMSQNEKERSR